MEIIVQVAGRAVPNKTDELITRFNDSRSALVGVDGFLKAEALINHNTLQVQVLYRFSEVDKALAFVKSAAMTKALDPFQGLVQAANTLVVSVVEGVIEP